MIDFELRWHALGAAGENSLTLPRYISAGVSDGRAGDYFIFNS